MGEKQYGIMKKTTEFAQNMKCPLIPLKTNSHDNKKKMNKRIYNLEVIKKLKEYIKCTLSMKRRTPYNPVASSQGIAITHCLQF